MIYALNQQSVTGVDVLRSLIAKVAVGDPVVLHVEREGALRYIAFEMADPGPLIYVERGRERPGGLDLGPQQEGHHAGGQRGQAHRDVGPARGQEHVGPAHERDDGGDRVEPHPVGQARGADRACAAAAGPGSGP